VQSVFKRLAKSDFKTALEKYEFYKDEVEFLGFIVGKGKIRIDPKKVKSIEE
jgi:hypothetical protein